MLLEKRIQRQLSGYIGFLLLVFSLVLIAPVSAQQAPDAGSILQQQQQLQQQLPQQLPQAEEPDQTQTLSEGTTGVKITVNTIQFSGALDMVSEIQLQTQVKPAIGQSLTFIELQALANKVTEYLRRQGWLLARAYLPRQDVTEGRLEITLIKGQLDGSSSEGGGWQINLSEDARIDGKRLSAIAEAAAPSGSAVRQEEMQRALLLINDLPGISARSRLEPGSATGTTRALVDVNEGPLYSGKAWLNNYGNHSTGEPQLNTALSLNDPSGIGDQGSLGITASEGIKLIRLGYQLPLGSNGLSFNAGYTNMSYEVVEGSGVIAGLEGDSSILSTGLRYPIIRSRNLSLYGSGSLDHKALKDDSNVGTLRDKRIDVMTLSLNGDSLDSWQGGGLNSFGVSLTSGDLDLSKVASDEASDAATLKTQGSYQKFNYHLSRLQRLPHNLTLLSRFSGQSAGGNLDSSEQFILGGPAGVRAYPVSEATGDEGWLLNIDLRYQLPDMTPWGALQFSVFADTGQIKLHHDDNSVSIPTASGKNSYSISGAGLGVQLSSPGQYNVGLIWASTVGDNDGQSVSGEDADGESDSSRFWLQASIWF